MCLVFAKIKTSCTGFKIWKAIAKNMAKAWVLFVSKVFVYFFIYTPSSVQAHYYSENVHRSTKRALHPLRLLYYIALFQIAIRLILSSIYTSEYTQYDLFMSILTQLFSHHLACLCIVAFIFIFYYTDVLFNVRVNGKVALMMTDLMVNNRKGKEGFTFPMI